MRSIERAINIIEREASIAIVTRVFPEDDTKVLKRLFDEGIINKRQLSEGLVANSLLPLVHQALNIGMS